MPLHDPDVSFSIDEPLLPTRHTVRWLGPFFVACGVFFIALSIYMRTHGKVPPVTRTEIAVAAPTYDAHAQNEQRGYVEPDAAWHAAMQETMSRLRPLRAAMPSPQAGDWLVEHPESGQTFAEYLTQHPIRPSARRSTLYVQPLGLFSDGQRRIIAQAAEYLAVYFHLPVKILPDLPTQIIPVSAVRRHPRTHELQMYTETLLDSVLAPRLPADAAAYLAFTAIDLFPHPRWNYVFGQASFDGRVGVWSLARFGNPARDDASFRLALLRTLKTATHEAGHMFGIHHCTAYLCNMNGANSLEEADRWPLELCPECLAKICWLTGLGAREWLSDMLSFFEKHDIKEEAAQIRRSLSALK